MSVAARILSTGAEEVAPVDVVPLDGCKCRPGMAVQPVDLAHVSVIFRCPEYSQPHSLMLGGMLDVLEALLDLTAPAHGLEYLRPNGDGSVAAEAVPTGDGAADVFGRWLAR